MRRVPWNGPLLSVSRRRYHRRAARQAHGATRNSSTMMHRQSHRRLVVLSRRDPHHSSSQALPPGPESDSKPRPIARLSAEEIGPVRRPRGARYSRKPRRPIEDEKGAARAITTPTRRRTRPKDTPRARPRKSLTPCSRPREKENRAAVVGGGKTGLLAGMVPWLRKGKCL